MSEKKEEEYSEEDEREKLSELGVSSTWDLLSSEEKKKRRESEKKPEYRGFQ